MGFEFDYTMVSEGSFSTMIPRYITSIKKRLRVEVWPQSFPDAIDVICMIGITAALVYSIFRWSPLLKGDLLAASPLSYALAYLLTSRLLRRRGLGTLRIFISLSSMVSGIWLYEIFYHYAYGIESLGMLLEEIGTIGLLTPAVGGPFPLPWSILMVLMVCVGYQYMHVKKWFFTALSVSLITFFFWVAVGYPQFHHPEWWSSSNDLLAIIPPDMDTVVAYSFFFNSLTKFPTAMLPSTLFAGARMGGVR